jgi:hypothetical protein
LIFEHLIEFNQLAMANAEGSDDMLNRVMTKDNIGLAALLETKEAAWSNGIRPDPSQIHQPLLVCTAHIHWDPQYCDVKLVQTMMLMHEVTTNENGPRQLATRQRHLLPALVSLSNLTLTLRLSALRHLFVLGKQLFQRIIESFCLLTVYDVRRKLTDLVFDFDS